MSKTMYVSFSSLKSGCVIPIAGYRHESNLILSAALLFPQTKITITNLPRLLDTDVMLEILSRMGAEISLTNNTVVINTEKIVFPNEIDQDLCEKIHGSIVSLKSDSLLFTR